MGDISIKDKHDGQPIVRFYDELTNDFLWMAMMYDVPRKDEEVSHSDSPSDWWKVEKVTWQFDNSPRLEEPPLPPTEFAQFGVVVYVSEIV